MIQIILQILSIIGIVILVILGLLLLIAGLVLFVPVRYRVRAEKEEKPAVCAKVHWLLHFLTVRFDYLEQGTVKIKIAGITIYDSGKPKKQKKSKKKTNAGEEKENTDNTDNIETTEKDAALKEADRREKEAVTSEKAAEEAKVRKEPEKKKNIFRKIIDFFRKLKYTIKHFYDTIKNVKDNIEYYMEVLKDEQTLALLKNGKTRLVKILKKVCPTKLEADVLFGTGSPDTTGYVLGLYGMLLPYLGNHVNITPDFETFVFRGRIFAKGRIRGVTMLINALHILFDPNLKPVIKKFKREA